MSTKIPERKENEKIRSLTITKNFDRNIKNACKISWITNFRY